MIKIGVIGCGHWGPNHIRIFSAFPEAQVVLCADTSAERLQSVKKLFPSVQPTTNYKEVLQNKDIDAICIATPTNTHFQFSKEALEHDKHVLCEKPLA